MFKAYDNQNVFAKILRGELSCQKVYEDDKVLVFDDIRPIAEIHFLIIPKKAILSLEHATEEDKELLGYMMLLAPKLARERGLTEGFRIIVNTGKKGKQEVPHLHIHVFGGEEKANQ